MNAPSLQSRLLVAAFAGLALLAPARSLAAEGTAPAPAAERTAAEATAAETTAQGAPPPATSTAEAPAPAPGPPETPARPRVQARRPQGSTPGGSAKARTRPGAKTPAPGQPGTEAEGSTPAAKRAGRHASAPSALTPSLPPSLLSSITGVPDFFIESFRIPPFLLPVFQAAGTAYGIPWQVLAAINEVETDYGRDLSVSSAGAEGWMQFLPAEWAQYAVDSNGDGFMDPYNPADAIFAAARYLRAAGGHTNIRSAVFSYNHSQAYVDSVMLRAQLLGGTPAELLAAITGLTEARFPVHAAAHFSDGFPAVPASGAGPPRTVVGTTIYSRPDAPVIAVQDGKIVQIGNSPALGRFIALRDAFGNTYVYGQLGEVSRAYPVLVPRVHSAVSSRLSRGASKAEPAPSGPATAGAQPRSPLSEAGTVSALSLGAAAALEPPPSLTVQPPAPSPRPPARPSPGTVQVFREGPNDVYLHPLRAGVQVIAGTVLGHVGSAADAGAAGPEPHLLFQIRPAGAGAPAIDPKPILDGWVALENTSIFRAKGENPFLATSPTTGQVLLESKQQLEPQVLHDAGIRLGRCGREAVQSGGVDKRVLAMLEYLSVSGLKPTVSGLACPASAPGAPAAGALTGASVESLEITAVNGVRVAGHQGQGSIADETVRKLLMLQGATRPLRILSMLTYGHASGALASPQARNAIHVTFAVGGRGAARSAAAPQSALSATEWIKLIARLGEIPDPSVARAPSSAAIHDPAPQPPTSSERQTGGNG